MSKKFLTSLKLVNLPEDPLTGSEGEIYFNTTSFQTRIYADGNWKYLSESAEELLIEVKNTTGTTLNKGTPVYITGTTGAANILTVGIANAASASTMPAVGLVTSNLDNEEEGFAQIGGFLRLLNTATIDGQTPTANQTVYVKAGGGLTLTKPTGTALIQNIAKVGRVHSNTGSLIVSSIMRTNDIPNIPENKFWLGNSQGVPVAVDFATEVNRAASATYLTESSISEIYLTKASASTTYQSLAVGAIANIDPNFPEHRPGLLYFNRNDFNFYISYADNWLPIGSFSAPENIILNGGNAETSTFEAIFDGGNSSSIFESVISGGFA